MALRLICALPNPGRPGAPRGMFYPDTPEGEKRAAEFTKQQDRPGWGVFECACLRFKDDADLEATFAWVLEQNNIKCGE
jgi:hypothetical protein